MTKMTATAAALALALACLPTQAQTPTPPEAATPAATAAPTASPWTDAEIDYLAAKSLELGFDTERTMCPARAWRKALAEGQEAFEQANPAYVAALAYEPTGTFADIAERKLEAYERGHDSFRAIMQMAPPDMRKEICDKAVATRAGTDFAAQRQFAREALAHEQGTPAPAAASDG